MALISGGTGRKKGRITAVRRKKYIRKGGKRQIPRKRDGVLSAAERRHLLQLVVSGSAFVLLVMVKLLLPEKIAAWNGAVMAVMEKDMDVEAVFAAVGDLFTSRGGMDEVYQAVFHPEETHNDAFVPAPVARLTALEELQTYRKYEPAEPLQSEPEERTDEEQRDSAAYILYSDGNLPENVSMEQTILGFDYCTPLKGTVTSDFGYRDHPLEGENRFHYGLDVAADTGTPVVCFADGKVTAVGESSSYGKYCMVEHDDGWTTLYAHCSRITASSGKTIAQGEKIAEVGATGAATGSHLHFELQRDGVYHNPVYYVAA